MKIPILYQLEILLKQKINKLFINKDDFSIISNNCWGTFIYKKFGIAYKSPFVNLFFFADDYIYLLENFSPEFLKKLSFIKKDESKYKKTLIEYGIYDDNYPIGILDNKVEVHFLHYTSESDAEDKWHRRLALINYKRLIFKFSDGDGCRDEHVEKFDAFDFDRKVCFVSKPFETLKSVICLDGFTEEGRVRDEWKHFKSKYNIFKVINEMK